MQCTLYFVVVAVQVFIHNPHSSSLQGGRAIASHDNDISILNINQQVSAVATGQLNNSGCDTLLVGTPTNFLAYDVENNSDLFYRDVSGPIWSTVHQFITVLIPVILKRVLFWHENTGVGDQILFDF